MLEHRDSQRQAHPPPRRELGHWHLEHVFREAHLEERLTSCIEHVDLLGLLNDVLQRVKAALAHLSELGVVNVDALEVSWHADNAAVDNLLHECGLASSIVAH